MMSNFNRAACNLKHVDIYTDGSCLGNPGPGGWSAVLTYEQHCKELCGGNPSTTNNRMELTAVISGLSALKYACEVTIFSDSKYVVDAINNGWVQNWKSKGWRLSSKSPVANIDLWEQVLSLLSMHQVKFVWVKGHAGNALNERCDKLARDCAKAMKAKV